MLHPRLNTVPIPIANKYREGNLKRTLERESKVPEILCRKGMDLVLCNASSIPFVSGGEVAYDNLHSCKY